MIGYLCKCYILPKPYLYDSYQVLGEPGNLLEMILKMVRGIQESMRKLGDREVFFVETHEVEGALPTLNNVFCPLGTK